MSIILKQGFDKLTEAIVFDLETTGFSPAIDRIVSICAIQIDCANAKSGDQDLVAFNALINPEMPIPPAASRVHKIKDAHVKDAPCFADIAEQLWNFIGDRPLIAHNIQFDIGFLTHEFARLQMAPLNNPRYCTMRAVHMHMEKETGEKHSFPKLADAAKMFGATPTGALHTADQDAVLALKIAVGLKSFEARSAKKKSGWLG